MRLIARILARRRADRTRRLRRGVLEPVPDPQFHSGDPPPTGAGLGTAGGDALRHDRQVRAFGRHGQEQLARLTVAVVGVGGAGSVMAQSFAHLGVGNLILADLDQLEESNLNRVVGATPGDAREGAWKVDVAARMVAAIDPAIRVATLRASVLDPHAWCALRAADVLVGAVDSHAARWALNHLAVQYARLYLDVGVAISRHDTLEVAGHLAAVRPDGPCLLCLDGYDPLEAARELQPELEQAKRAAGYLDDEPDERAPSVLFLNQAVAAEATAELLNWVAPWRPAQTYVLVDLSSPATTSISGDRDPACPVCGPGGVRGLGDLGGIPVGRPHQDLPPPTQGSAEFAAEMVAAGADEDAAARTGDLRTVEAERAPAGS